MSLRFGKALACFIVFFALTSCARSNAVEVGQTAPDFSLMDTDSRKTSLSDFKGKGVILNFFANWCPPCKAEIPDFISLQKVYGEKGFTFIGVSLVSAQESKDFAAKMGINYPILVDDGKVSSLYGPVRSIPTTFVIDKNMKVVKMFIGSRPKSEFETEIKGLLK